MRPHADSLPSPLDLACQCHAPVHRLSEQLRLADTQARLAEDDDACRRACLILAGLREQVNHDIAEVRAALGMGE